MHFSHFEYAGNDGDDITIRAVDPDLDFWKRSHSSKTFSVIFTSDDTLFLEETSL